MISPVDLGRLKPRNAQFEMSPEEFREAGHDLIDQLADFIGSLPERPVTSAKTPSEVRDILGRGGLPAHGVAAKQLLAETAQLLFEHSLFNGHPRFWGYITASAAPIGALADLLAAVVNPNIGAWSLAPMASEIEAQTVRWIAELIGYPTDSGGLMVSGGNTANFVGFLAARRAKLGEHVRSKGLRAIGGDQPVAYCSAETHTWIEKAADHYGLGTDHVRWVPTDDQLRMDVEALRHQLEQDKADGFVPFLVVGTGGSTAVGTVDPLPAIAEVCREHELWFHVDGAYGGFAAQLPEAPPDLRGLSQADSVAIDPHKWLYSALEAGCVLVRDPNHLVEAFSYHPTYYKFEETTEEPAINYYEFGPQNSRGFRALKVWLGIRQVGREGHLQMMSDDIHLTVEMFRRLEEHPEIEAVTRNLSIATFRFRPSDLSGDQAEIDSYLNQLNEALLTELQSGGEVFVSNAVIGKRYLLRACIVNFRTALEDVRALPDIVARLGASVDAEMRPGALRAGG